MTVGDPTKDSGLIELAQSGGTQSSRHVLLAQSCCYKNPDLSTLRTGALLRDCDPVVSLVTALEAVGIKKKRSFDF